MDAEMIRLYTRQNDKTLDMLERDGRIYNVRAYVRAHFGDIADHFLQCYDWISAEAAKRVPRPEGVSLPIWCALSKETCSPPIEGTVVYVVDTPRSKVVFFDDGKWDYVLNHMYLPSDTEDAAAYRRHLREAGFTGSHAAYADPVERRRITESWLRVFDVPDMSAPTVCAHIWEINAADIVRILRPGESVLDV